MKAIERIKMVKAMEFVARQINNEEIFYSWLLCGVADGDILYGQLEASVNDESTLDVYIEDDAAADNNPEHPYCHYMYNDNYAPCEVDETETENQYNEEE